VNLKPNLTKNWPAMRNSATGNWRNIRRQEKAESEAGGQWDKELEEAEEAQIERSHGWSTLVCYA